MTSQLGMFEAGAYNTLQVKMNARTTDPAPSKRAAAKLKSQAIRKSLALFRSILWDCGPLTVREASKRTINPDYWNAEFNKRVHQWHVAGHIEVAREDPQGRVWRVKE